MKTIERKDFNKYTSVCGSDCWNIGHIVRQALIGTPNALAIDIKPVLSGLYADIVVHYQVGDAARSFTRRVF